LSVDFSCAKAHYYHAVGLTEKDDIVGACEHYLIALEIMEPLVETSPQWRLMANDKSLKTKGKGKGLCDSNKEDYEKIRFVALIYTRLGDLFLSKDYYEISLKMFKLAHRFIKLCHGKMSEVNVLKNIGNVYQLSNNLDSALFYYNKSLALNSNTINKLDLEKCIALILFEKGERDSAYHLIRNNLNKTDNYVAKHSYYLTLSRIFYIENKCDSAITYLKLSINAPDKHTRLMASIYLSDIFDSIGDNNQKYYYDSITLSILSKDHNNSVDVIKLQDVYSKYTDKKQKNGRVKMKLDSEKQLTKFTIAVFIIIVVLLIFIFIIQYKKKKDKMIYETRLLDKEFEIIEKKEEIEKIVKTNDNLNAKLENLKSEESFIITENSIIEYYNCNVCKRILSEISNIEDKNLKINNIASLSKDDLLALEMSANMILGGYIQHIQMKYPTLKKQDINCICLSILDINEPTMASLLGKSYNAVWSRMKKIRAIMNIKSNAELLYV
jgi:tetratricopeptide (TPR) repeat protein